MPVIETPASRPGSAIPAATRQMAAAIRDARFTRLPAPVALYLLCILIPVGFNVGPLAITALRLLLMVMIIPLTIRLISGGLGRVFATDILFILHILWATVALAVNNPAQVVQQVGSVGVEFIGGYLLARAYVRTPEVFIALCKWLVILVCLMVPLALYEAWTGRPLLIEILHKFSLTPVAIVTTPGRMGLERVQAVFAHPIHFGLFCSVVFSLSFVALKGIVGTGWRYASSFIIAFSGLLALSSGALLAIALQIALILWSSIFARVQHRWWLLVALFAAAYVIIDIFSNRTPLKVFMTYATFSAHTAYWRSIIFEWGMKSVWSNPFVGIGLRDWVRPLYMRSGSMDNFWLVIAVRYGIPGFLFVVSGYALAVFSILRQDFTKSVLLTQIRRAWIFTFLGLSFTLCTVHIWTNIYSFVFFMFGCGIWLVKAAPSEHPEATTYPEQTGNSHRNGIQYSRFPVK